MASVDIKNAVKFYGAFQALFSVNVAIEDGEFVVLVGPSGCGKSTLLRMIAGLERIDGGEISIGGTVVNSMPPKDRDVAMVFQNYALYPHKTVRQNMAFSLRMRRVNANEIEPRVLQAAEITGPDGKSRPVSASAIRRSATARCHGTRAGAPTTALFV